MDFTIVTASYNYGHYIGECLESVAAQVNDLKERRNLSAVDHEVTVAGAKHNPLAEHGQGGSETAPPCVTFEHLIIDAGSTDDTCKVVAGYPHAQFFQEPDKGMTDAINKGFRKAKGEWVMWLNADDRLKPGALKAVREFAEKHPKADVIYGGWEFVDAKGAFLRRMPALPFDFRILVQQGCYIGSTACFYRRKTTIAEGHLLDDQFGYCMDGEYYARLAHLGKSFVPMPEILADFRLHGESISQSSLGKDDMKNLLRMQRQAAEPRAIRRMYGIKPFRDENLSLVVDGVLYHLYRFKKGILRVLRG
jgi:glycosyltransferase involved in cell wall biosynthesis